MEIVSYTIISIALFVILVVIIRAIVLSVRFKRQQRQAFNKFSDKDMSFRKWKAELFNDNEWFGN